MILYSVVVGYLYFLLAGRFNTALEVVPRVNLLLPGFRGHKLQASLLDEVRL